MNCADTTPADLRKLAAHELEALGQNSLREHLVAQAMVAHSRYGPLSGESLEAFLRDPECLRYPTRLVFEFGEMAFHQFAQPAVDWERSEGAAVDGRILYVRPLLRERPDLLPLAVAYMIPVINYGEVAADGHCLAYGATLLGLLEEEYYQKLCDLCHLTGTAERHLPADP